MRGGPILTPTARDHPPLVGLVLRKEWIYYLHTAILRVWVCIHH